VRRTKPTADARDRLLATADRLFYADGIRAVGIDRVIADAACLLASVTTG
jgi:AcrR family transcriptional regulator